MDVNVNVMSNRRNLKILFSCNKSSLDAAATLLNYRGHRTRNSKNCPLLGNVVTLSKHIRKELLTDAERTQFDADLETMNRDGLNDALRARLTRCIKHWFASITTSHDAATNLRTLIQGKRKIDAWLFTVSET